MTPAHRSSTLAALAVAATPPGRRQPGLTMAAGTTPAAVAAPPHAVAAPAIDWDAIAGELNAMVGLQRNDQSGLWGRK